MRLKIDKSFVKDTDKLNDQKIKQKIALCIDQILVAKTTDEILNLKKLLRKPIKIMTGFRMRHVRNPSAFCYPMR